MIPPENPQDKEIKIRQMLNFINKEVVTYHETGKELWLQQASEKAWTAYILLLELLNKRELNTHRAVANNSWNLINSGIIQRELYRKANGLHVYHYEGRTDIEFILEDIRFVVNDIRSVLNATTTLKSIRVDESKKIISKTGKVFSRNAHLRGKGR